MLASFAEGSQNRDYSRAVRRRRRRNGGRGAGARRNCGGRLSAPSPPPSEAGPSRGLGGARGPTAPNPRKRAAAVASFGKTPAAEVGSLARYNAGSLTRPPEQTAHEPRGPFPRRNTAPH